MLFSHNVSSASTIRVFITKLMMRGDRVSCPVASLTGSLLEDRRDLLGCDATTPQQDQQMIEQISRFFSQRLVTFTSRGNDALHGFLPDLLRDPGDSVGE